MGDLLYIRDSVLVDDKLRDRLRSAAEAGSRLRVVARSVRHAKGYTLQLPGADLTIIAQHYDANGGGVSVAGAAGATGTAGAGGLMHGFGTDGGPGHDGAVGGTGATGGSIRLLCEHLVQGRFCADGGPGGTGGAGGQGGRGGSSRPPIPGKTQGGTVAGAGGPGGDGGSGGSGGAAGSVSVGYLSVDAAPACTASGGAGGAGGAPGAGGPGGIVLDYGDGGLTWRAAGQPRALDTAQSAPDGPPGKPGPTGAAGAAGTTTIRQLSEQQYWTEVAAVLGSDVAAWADARLAAGKYFYRRENLPASGGQANLAVAAGEFARVLRLRPDDTDAGRLARQIAHDQNILGLPHNLDVTPDFGAYMDAYTSWSGQVFGVFDEAITTLLHGTDLATMQAQLNQHVDELKSAVVTAGADHAAAVAGQKTAAQNVKDATAKVNQLTSQIEAAKKAMEDESISIGGIISTVAEVAGAVVAVIAAIPTAGTSLVALVPACLSLARTAFDDGPALISSLFGDGSIPKEVKDAYDKAGQDVHKLVAAGQAIINLVNVIEKLDQAKTAANAKYADLVRQGVEAGHALALAQLGAAQADLQVAAAQVKLVQAKQQVTSAEDLLAKEKADEADILRAAQTLIGAAELRRDDLLENAFLAQRAVEIYTNTDESSAVRMDAGYLHPDVLADHAAGYTSVPEILDDYATAWTYFLTPMTLQDDYMSYFNGTSGQLDVAWHRITLRSRQQLAAFRKSHRFGFEIRLRDLPAHHYEAKVMAVAVSFVGATSPSGVTTCEASHGGRYEQKLASGARCVQLLQAHTDTVLAPHTRLSAAGVSAAPVDPLKAPLTSPIWGRGVAGQWTLAIPRAEITRHHTSLRKLTEIDIWIAYQFRTA